MIKPYVISPKMGDGGADASQPGDWYPPTKGEGEGRKGLARLWRQIDGKYPKTKPFIYLSDHHTTTACKIHL